MQIPKEESLENISKALEVEVKELFDYSHLADKDSLITKINKILELSDEKTVQKYYRILINL